MIQIDGSRFEGGGQILRTAISLSALLKEPVEVSDIRKSREEPGLKQQHLMGVRFLAKLCNAKVIGDEIGSTNLKFWPGEITGQTLDINIGTAGSITLLLQSIILPSIFASSQVRLKITGGTDVNWSPSIDYFTNVMLPHLSTFTKNIKFSLKKRGYYPKGGGNIDLLIHPLYKASEFKIKKDLIEKIKAENKKIDCTLQGTILQIKGVSHASKDLAAAEVADRQARSARMILKDLGAGIDIQVQYCDTLSTGSGITLWARFSLSDNTEFSTPMIIGADALGERGKKSEVVGEEAAKKLKEDIDSKAAVDTHLSDQLIPFLALFGGSIKVPSITQHTLANIYVCESFLGKRFVIDEENSLITAN